MALAKGVNFTKYDEPSPDVIQPGEVPAHVMTIYDEYTAAALELGSTIEMGRNLPDGAKILELIVINEALGAGVTLEIGDAEDPDRYITSYDGNTAAVKDIQDMVPASIGYRWDLTAPTTPDNIVTVTTGVAAATGLIRMWIKYTINI